MTSVDPNDPCPCGSGQSFSNCCQPVIQARSAETAEALMRSRYTAFVIQDSDYLLESWSGPAKPNSVSFDPAQHWLGLKIKRTEAGGVEDMNGVAEFVARYKINGRGHRLHETSQFEKVDGRWLYVNGETHSS